MSEHWSDYWQQGHLTSFGDSFKGNYTGDLANVWDDIFLKLTSGFSVLDIATGNGALPYLLDSYMAKKEISGEVVGVDIATINENVEREQLAKEIKITLLSDINCNKLAFEDGKFNLVISQFGVEYSDIKLSLPETLRVLRTGGTLALVVHHRNSLVIKRNQRILALIENPITSKLFDKMFTLTDSMGSITTKSELVQVKENPVCEANRVEINHIINELVSIDEEALQDSELLNYVAVLFQEGLFWPVEKKHEYLRFAKNQIGDTILRLDELVKASVDDIVLCDWLQLVSANGGGIESITVLKDESGSMLGWVMSFLKRESSS